jgi:pyruvate ferredoxin oxidoreductase gamma subunit
VQDATLLGHVDVFGGLRRGGPVIVNSPHSPAELAARFPALAYALRHAVTIPATELALTHVGKAVPSGALLGAFAAVTGVLRLESVAAAFREKFPARLADGNIAAATAAYEDVRRRGLTLVAAAAEGDTGAQAN